MAWVDIDFNLMIPGMITQGDNLVSFADYLNEFSTALDERSNMVQRGTPTLLNITFEKGEISNEIFEEKIRDLIGGYSDLWFDYTYYSSGVLTNPADPATYEITAADLELAVGAEAWDILQNYPTMTIGQMYKASIFQAFYTIYENTGVVRQNSTSADDTPLQNVPTIEVSSRSDMYRMAQNDGAVGESYSTLLSNTPWVLYNTAQNFDIATISYRAKRRLAAGDYVWRISEFSLNRSQDGLYIKLLSKDLLGNVLNMDFSQAVLLDENCIEYNYPLNPSSYLKYEASLPLVKPTDSNELINYARFSRTQEVDGTSDKYQYQGINPHTPQALQDESLDQNAYTERQGLDMEFNDEHFIDINNSALEFYIAP